MHDFLAVGLWPFSILAGFIVVLLVFETLLMLVGLSSQIEIDTATPLDGNDGFLVETADFSGLSHQELALLDLSQIDVEQKSRVAVRPPYIVQLFQLFGLGEGPILIWLTALAAGISACGFLLQLGLEGVVGFMLPPSMAVAIVLIPGLWIGRRLSRWVSRMVPSFETHAISGQTYHGRRGHVVIGQSRRGAAAQVRWQDLYGTTHSLMAEPLRDDDTIDAGTEVLIVKTRSREPRLVAIN